MKRTVSLLTLACLSVLLGGYTVHGFLAGSDPAAMPALRRSGEPGAA